MSKKKKSPGSYKFLTSPSFEKTGGEISRKYKRGRTKYKQRKGNQERRKNERRERDLEKERRKIEKEKF